MINWFIRNRIKRNGYGDDTPLIIAVVVFCGFFIILGVLSVLGIV